MTTSNVGIRIGLEGTQAVTTGLQRVQTGLGQLQTQTESVSAALQRFAPQLAGALTIGGLVALVRQTVNAIDAMNDLADATGASIEEISKLDQVARRNGASLDSVGGMLVKFNAALKEADGKNGASIALQAIGLEAAKLRQLDPAVALQQTAAALAGFADDGNKARIVQELFGKSVREAAPFLKDAAEAGQLNASVTAQQAAEAEKFNKQLFAFKAEATDVARTIVNDLLPSLTQLIQQLIDGRKAYKSFWDATVDIGLNVDPFKSLNANLTDTVKEIGTYRNIVNELQSRSGPDIFGRRAAEIEKYQKRLETAIARERYLLQQLGREGGGRGDVVPGAANAPKRTLVDINAEAARRKAAEEAAAALLKQQEAYDKLRTSIEERTAAGQLELTQGEAVTEAQRLQIKINGDYAAGLLKLTPAQKAVIDSKLADLTATEKQIKADQDAMKGAKALADARAEARRSEDRAIAEFQAAETARAAASLASVKGRITSLKDEVQATELARQENISLAEAIELVAIQRLLEAQQKLTEGSERWAEIEREIEARRELAKLIGDRATVEAGRRAAEETARNWELAFERVSNGLVDAIMRGGRSAADYLKNLFRQLVLRPVVEAVVNPIVGAVGSALGLATGTAAASSGAASGASAAGAGLAAGGLASMFSGFTGSVGAGLQMALAGNASAAFGVAGSSMAAGSTASGLGLGIGAAMPYVLAAAAVLNALGVFRSKKIVGGGLTGTLGAGNIQSYDLQRIGGTLFSGPDYSMVNERVSAESQAIQKAYEALRTNAANMAESLGLGSAAVRNFTTTLGTDIVQNDIGVRGIKLDGLTPEQAAQKVQQALATANEELAAFVLGTSRATFARDGETAIQTLSRLAGSLGNVNAVMRTLNLSLYDTSLNGADLASKLIDASGGMDAFKQATATYYQAFYSDAERVANTTRDVTEALAAVGLSLPRSRAEFRALVEAQDQTTDAGAKAFVTLMQVSGAFASLSEAAANASKAMQDEIDRLRSSVATGSDMRSGAELLAQFSILSAQARAGDVSAMSQLPALSKALEKSAELGSSSSLDLLSTQAYLASSLQQTLAGPTSTESAAAMETRLLREDNRAIGANLSGLLTRLSRIVDRWDVDGMPAERAT